MSVSLSQLKAIMPNSSEENRARFLEPLNKAMAEFRINTPLRISAFLAQLAHESSHLSRIVESTYYKDPARLLALFPRDFKDVSDASEYVKSPEKCANRIYANQNGNGGESSGDGWKYRGRGLIQLTGRANYAECGKALGLEFVGNPELLEQPESACRSAAWFWSVHGCNDLADVGMFGAITKKINGGYNGAKERLAVYAAAKKAIGIA